MKLYSTENQAIVHHVVCVPNVSILGLFNYIPLISLADVACTGVNFCCIPKFSDAETCCYSCNVPFQAVLSLVNNVTFPNSTNLLDSELVY